ncbi:MAG TPA: carboxypeptidase-like regulatory domain-containing protein, partial [Puia sp.]|nr:carboxypeptidase-like regulatory domain-containing protein [Puia sp.]
MRKKRLFVRVGVLCLLVLLGFPALSQKTVTGRVTDPAGKPLSGVSVVPKGTGNGTTTDNQGQFRIDVNPSVKVLVFSSIGFTTREMPITGNVIDLSLATSNSSLTDVVVIGYGAVKRSDVTGAVATISSKDFQTGAITTPDQLIAGKLAGVSVTPGSG